MKIGLILFIGGVNYAILTTALALMDVLDEYVDNELYLGFRDLFNTTRKDCVWRNAYKDRKLCAKDVKIWLYSNGSEELIDPRNPNWLQSSNIWDKRKENVIFIHGYAAGDIEFSPNARPTVFMRDTFIEYGQYNFFMIDYGPVSRAPCYVALVQNIKYVSRCVASYLKHFLSSGMPRQSITCVGHSMGAHGCGLLRRYLGFRIKKIIGLDAALPLISSTDRLSWRDANLVQTIQTNAGYYGDIGTIGHLDVCVNDGNMQPFCIGAQNPNLCSHVYALCYMAQSLFDHENPLVAASCDEVCPHLSVFQLVKGFNAPDYLNPHSNSIDSDIPENIVFGMNISDSARGSYCLLNVRRPFCSMNKNKIGSRRCCSFAEMFADSDNSKLNFNLKLH